jgi:hypothetical protein
MPYFIIGNMLIKNGIKTKLMLVHISCQINLSKSYKHSDLSAVNENENIKMTNNEGIGSTFEPNIYIYIYTRMKNRAWVQYRNKPLV